MISSRTSFNLTSVRILRATLNYNSFTNHNELALRFLEAANEIGITSTTFREHFMEKGMIICLKIVNSKNLLKPHITNLITTALMNFVETITADKLFMEILC